MHPLMHFLLRNLHAPQGDAGVGASSDTGWDSSDMVAARLPIPFLRVSDMAPPTGSVIRDLGKKKESDQI